MILEDYKAGVLDYSYYNERHIIRTGVFNFPRYGYRVGQMALRLQKCNTLEVYVLDKVIEVREPGDCILLTGGLIRYPLVLTSLYDQIKSIHPEELKLLEINKLHS